MTTQVALDVLPIIISAIALTIAAVSMRRQWRSARNANAVAAILKLFEEYRSDDLKMARRTVFEMSEFDVESAPALRDLPDEVRRAAERVAQYFDHVGLLVGHRLAPARPMISFFGVGCETLWEKLAPCVAVERQLRKVDYYLGYFEALAALSEKIGADGLNKKITTKMRLGRVPLK